MRLHTALIAAALAAANAAPALAESYDLDAFYAEVEALNGAAGINATFRGKTLTVTGTFGRFVDVGHGDYVSVYFDNAPNTSWALACTFPRDDTAAYDRFALMQPGTVITATGRFDQAKDIYFFVNLQPCQAE